MRAPAKAVPPGRTSAPWCRCGTCQGESNARATSGAALVAWDALVDSGEEHLRVIQELLFYI